MAVLEEAEQGKSWGNLQGVLMLRHLSAVQLAQWLKAHSSRWVVEQPEQHQELARRLLMLGRVASGELATIASAIGTQLQVSTVLPLPPEGSPPVTIAPVVKVSGETGADESALTLEAVWQQAIAQHEAGNYESAIASYEQALKLGSSGISMLNQIRLTDLHGFQPFGKALKCLPRTFIYRILKSLKLQPDLSPAWNNRGLALDALGRYEEAIAGYEQALKLQPDYSNAWFNRGITALSSSHYNPSYQQQFSLHFSFSCAQIPQCIQFNTLSAAEAEASLQESWQTSQQLLVNTFNPQQVPASLLEVIERPLSPELAQLLQQPPSPALYELVRQPPSAEVLDRIHQDSLHHPSLTNPQLHQRGYLGEIASYQAELDKAIGRETHPEGWGYLHHRIGQAHSRQARQVTSPTSFWRQAERSFKTALQVLQPPQFEALHLEVVQDLVRVLIDLDETPEAKELQRRGTDLLQRMLAAPQRTAGQKRTLALKFAGFEQLTVNLALQREDLNGALSLAENSKNTCLRWLLGIEEIPDISHEAIQALLTENTAILYWHLSPIALTTFLLLPQSPTPLVIPPPDQSPSSEVAFPELMAQPDDRSPSLRQLLAWEAWLTDWNQAYASYSTPKDQTAQKKTTPQTQHPWRLGMVNRLNALKAILNGSAIAPHLKENAITQLILIPHRDLHRFPLHWLLEDYTCAYLPSAHFGLALKQRHLGRSSLQSLMLVENPKSSPAVNSKLQKLAPLPFAEVEAALVWHLLTEHAENGTSHILPSGDQTATHATLTASLTQPHQVLHFTGHGAYNSLDPALSCLFLEGSDRLTLGDIVPLDLSAYHLVCLAACETAVTGDQTITTEYVGLVSAFLKAQVGCVVSTLWRVESAASAILVVQFYRELHQGQSPPLALKAAQTFLRTATRADLVQWLDWAIPKLPRSLSLILESERELITIMTIEQPYSHPYYWAAFTLSGL